MHWKQKGKLFIKQVDDVFTATVLMYQVNLRRSGWENYGKGKRLYPIRRGRIQQAIMPSIKAGYMGKAKCYEAFCGMLYILCARDSLARAKKQS